MNVYRCRFMLICPANGIAVTYALEVEAVHMIRVEAIQTAILDLGETGFHEDAADKLFVALGGRQTLRAHHHGVDIETLRG